MILGQQQIIIIPFKNRRIVLQRQNIQAAGKFCSGGDNAFLYFRDIPVFTVPDKKVCQFPVQDCCKSSTGNIVLLALFPDQGKRAELALEITCSVSYQGLAVVDPVFYKPVFGKYHPVCRKGYFVKEGTVIYTDKVIKPETMLQKELSFVNSIPGNNTYMAEGTGIL